MHMVMEIYFNTPVEYEVLEKDENLSVRYTDDGYKISFKEDDEAGIYSIMDVVIDEGWVVGNAEKLLEYMKANYGLVVKPDPVKTSRETTIDIESEVCLGMSHCGAVYSRGSGTLELSDEEVSKLVAIVLKYTFMITIPKPVKFLCFISNPEVGIIQLLIDFGVRVLQI